MHIRVEFVAAT
uniref:Uncharacterized protein n=1 Tax=Leersia perrieri TaxID=77586 RepID=A0A0D9XDY0_9ORYZ